MFVVQVASGVVVEKQLLTLMLMEQKLLLPHVHLGHILLPLLASGIWTWLKQDLPQFLSRIRIQCASTTDALHFEPMTPTTTHAR